MKNKKHHAKGNQEGTQAPPATRHEVTPANITKTGNISGGKGFAIGTGAKAIVIEIGSLINLGLFLRLLKRNWLLIVASAFLQLALLVFWLLFKDRFLIRVQTYCFSAVLLETGILAGISLLKKPHQIVFE